MSLALNNSVRLTLETAPRSLEELMLVGRYRLRDLAMVIGLGETSEARSALTNMSLEDLAKLIQGQLQRLDTEQGVAAPAAAATTPTEPAPAPATPAAAPATPPKRSPRAAAQPAPAPAAATPPEVLAALNKLTEICSSLSLSISGLQGQITNLATNLAGQGKEQLYQQQLNTALSLFFAEETLGGARPEILQQALVDLPDIVTLVEKARGGKK